GGGDVFRAAGIKGSAVLLGERERLHARGLVADAAVADAGAVGRDRVDDRSRARLLDHRVLVVALEERVILEVAVSSRSRVAAVEGDRLLGPISGQAELAPGRGVGGRPAPPTR